MPHLPPFPPEFWAVHYCNITGSEDRDSTEVVEAAFNIPHEKIDDHYLSLLGPEGKAPLIAVPTTAGYDIGVQYVDCGEHGTEVRYSLGHREWKEREPLGYDSPHFALPAFRWTEVELIARAQTRRSAGEAAAVMLLLFPAVYLLKTDDAAAVEEALAHAWRQLMLPPAAIPEGLIHNAVENQQDHKLTWTNDPELGWINDNTYSFRNPKTPMTKFNPGRFARVRAFLEAMESRSSSGGSEQIRVQ